MFGGGEHNVKYGLYVLQSGLRSIDTAQVYRTETEVGETLKKSGLKRENIHVTSKSEPCSPKRAHDC